MEDTVKKVARKAKKTVAKSGDGSSADVAQSCSDSKLMYKVVDSAGKQVGEVGLNSKVFAGVINKSVVQQTVRWQLAKRRSGTHKTLTKGMMKGGGRKPWKQKGTGQARSGSNTSPVWVGGGVAHGPQPRSYEFRLPKRSRSEALVAVLSEKAKKGRLLIVDGFDVSGKTKDFVKLTQDLGIKGRKLVLVVPDEAKNSALWKSARNVKGVLPLPLSGVNVYDLLNHEYLVIGQQVVAGLENRARVGK